MRAFLEYIPLIVFFITYKFLDIYWATASLIVTSALQIIYLISKKEKVPTRNWIFFGLMVVFGGLTIFMHDDLFLKWKVTVINGVFALALLISQYFFKKNLIKGFLSEALTLPENIWVKLNFAWAMFFAFCGLLNLHVAFNYSQETWVNFKVFGLMGLTLVFALTSILSLYKYLPKDEAKSSSSEKDS